VKHSGLEANSGSMTLALRPNPNPDAEYPWPDVDEPAYEYEGPWHRRNSWRSLRPRNGSDGSSTKPGASRRRAFSVVVDTVGSAHEPSLWIIHRQLRSPVLLLVVGHGSDGIGRWGRL